MKTELPLHDATFDGIVTSGRTATLYFSRSDGSGCAVELSGVRDLQMDDFQQGNIVTLFETTSGEPLQSSADLTRLFTPPHPSASDEYHTRYANFVSSRLAEIEAGSLTFVEMSPAVGADLLAVCEEVVLKSHGSRVTNASQS